MSKKVFPFDVLVPNAKTVAAMKAARSGKLETVTIEEICAVINAVDTEPHKPDSSQQDDG